MHADQEEGVNEDGIDCLKLPQAIRKAKKHDIDISNLKTLEDVRCVLKRHLLRDKLSRKSCQLRKMQSIGSHFMIYSVITDYTAGLIKKKDPLIDKLNQSFPDFHKLLVRQKIQLEGKVSKSPILTGAGKSSFINLLLGEDILPCSVLSNTNVICEIQYGEEAFAFVYPRDESGPPEKIKFSENFIDELSKKIQKTEDQDSQQNVYKKAEIYLPKDILKTGVTIVDSPGIGDTEEMTNMVLDYIMEACAFIYVINSANAGGVQTDRLMKSPTGWPECKPDQIIKLSTREAKFIQKDGYIVGQFYKIIMEINRLVPLGREILILNAFRLLSQFLKKALFCIETVNIQNSSLSQEEQEEAAKDFVDSLKLIKKEVQEFFDEQKQYLSEEINRVAKKLSKFLHEPQIMDKMCIFTDGSVKGRDWKETMIQVRSEVYDNLSKQIQEWEKINKEFEKVGLAISRKFQDKFPDFDDRLSRVENKFSRSGREERNHFDSHAEFEESFVPVAVKQKFANLNLGLKVLVGISLSPVFLLGAVVRLPIWGIKELKRILNSHLLEKTYHKDEKLAIRKYAELTLKSMVDPVQFIPLLEQELAPLSKYLDQQRNKVLRQIDVEIMIIEARNSELLDSAKAFVSIDPIYRKFQQFEAKRKLFQLTYFERPDIEIPSSCLEIDETANGIICDGVLSRVMSARSLDTKLTKSYLEVTVRRSKIEMDHNEIENYFKEEFAYRGIKKPHIVRTIGIIKDLKVQMHQIDEEKRVKLASIHKPKILPASFFPLDCKDVARYVHFPYEILITPSQVMYEHKHDMYSFGIVMWELFNTDRAFRKEIFSMSNPPATLKDFVEYLKRGNNICTYSDHGLSPSRVWKEMTKRCLTFDMAVDELLEWQTHFQLT
ncbi:hypothetical protein KUTeg_016039, partial [Tegillarca granosa]